MNIKLNKKITPQKALKETDELISWWEEIYFLEEWKNNDSQMIKWQKKLCEFINMLFKNRDEVARKLLIYDIETIDLKKITTPDKFNSEFNRRKSKNKKLLKFQGNKVKEIKKTIKNNYELKKEITDDKLFTGQNKSIKGNHDLPQNINWEKLIFKIKEGLSEVEICYNNNHKGAFHYTNLGFFSGRKQQNPDNQWGLLVTLSIYTQNNEEKATVCNVGNMIPSTLSSISPTFNNANIPSNNSVHQIKKNLAKQLKKIFTTQESPFYDYRDRGYYKPKFTLIPPPKLRYEEPWKQGGKLNENASQDDLEKFIDPPLD